MQVEVSEDGDKAWHRISGDSSGAMGSEVRRTGRFTDESEE